MKKAILIIVSVILIAALIGGVGYVVWLANKKNKESDDTFATKDSVSVQNAPDATRYSEHFKIGIVQTGLGSASKDCYGGFMLELDERKMLSNLEVVYVVEDNKELCRQKIQELVDGGCDLLYTIGRYASETAAEITKDIPIVFGAVTSPDKIGLVETNGVPGGNVTGVSSYTPCFEQIELIPTLLPKAKNIAVMYNANDLDATGQGLVAKRYAEEQIGLSASEFKVDDQDKKSLETALKSIKEKKAEVLYIPADKFLSANIATIVKFSYENKIPVICGDEATLSQGAYATSEINYESIGRKAAGMAVDILFNKKDVATLSVMYKHDCKNIVNKEVGEKLELEIPATAYGKIDLWEPPTEPPAAPAEAAPSAIQGATAAPEQNGE